MNKLKAALIYGGSALISILTLWLCAQIVRADTVLTVSVEPIVIKVTQLDDCSITWTAPTQREDGAALSPEEIQSYTIYGGREPGIYTSEVLVTGTTEILCSAFEISEPDTWYFAGITTDTDGVNSELSNEILKAVNPVNRPVKLIFTVEGQ